MPEVRMRRSTRRVFGARVLRSGRQVKTTAPSEEKQLKAVLTEAGAGEEWINILESSRETGVKVKYGSEDVELNDSKMQDSALMSENRWGAVYSRKRKRVDCVDEDRRFGKYYVRRRYPERKRFLGILVKSSSTGNGLLGRFLESVLSYMFRADLGLLQLTAFILSQSFSCAFSSGGIHFMRDSVFSRRSGICIIYGSNCSLPLFMVDFTALPSYFMYMHKKLFLGFTRSLCLLPSFPTNLDDIFGDKMVVDEVVETVNLEPCISMSTDDSVGTQIIPSVNVNPVKKSSFRISIGATRIPGRSVQFKSGIITRSIQKRRSSLRSSRVRSSSVCGRVANGTLLSGLSSFRHDTVPLAPPRQSNFRRNSARRNTSLKSSPVGLTKDIGSASCFADILVDESVKCYRIAGAVVMLEKSVSGKWSLAVKKDGRAMYCLNPKRIMRPCSSNRVTRNIIWREENHSWKLEFPDRGDWAIFRDLYKECSERNVKALSDNIIPVPGVQEVSDYGETSNATFTLPNLYITVRDGELSRALAKETANYDMDSEDEEWLKKFNKDSSLRNEHWDHVSEDSFEMLIDAFERAFFRNADVNLDEKEAVSSCLHLERKGVVEAIYSYWMRKREQKRSSLIRVFQCYQPKKAQLLTKPVVRKKRSFKRQPSRIERANQRTFFPVLVAPELDPVDEHKKALLKLEEAKAATARSVAAAMEKRNMAQLLMEKADVATYKAAMALRIAESIEMAESLGISSSLLLD